MGYKKSRSGFDGTAYLDPEKISYSSASWNVTG